MGAERLKPLLVLLLAAVAAGCQGGAQPGDDTETAEADGPRFTVVRINDGDTLTVSGAGKVRLLQVDAPELTTDCHGVPALEALRKLAPVGARVTLAADPALDDRDRYGRPLRYVFAGGTNVNVALVRRGAASPYFFRNERGRYSGELLDAVAEARSRRAGYWGACPGAELNPGLGSITGRRR